MKMKNIQASGNNNSSDNKRDWEVSDFLFS